MKHDYTLEVIGFFSNKFVGGFYFLIECKMYSFYKMYSHSHSITGHLLAVRLFIVVKI